MGGTSQRLSRPSPFWIERLLSGDSGRHRQEVRRQRLAQSPGDGYRPVASVADVPSGAEGQVRRGAELIPLLVPGEDEDGTRSIKIAPACWRVDRRRGLRFPVEEVGRDRVVGIHGGGRVSRLGLLQSYEEDINIELLAVPH